MRKLLISTFCLTGLLTLCSAQQPAPSIPTLIRNAPYTATFTETQKQGGVVLVQTGTQGRRSDGSIFWETGITYNGVADPSHNKPWIHINDLAKRTQVNISVYDHIYETFASQNAASQSWHPMSAEEYLQQQGGEGAKHTAGISKLTTLGIRVIGGIKTVGIRKVAADGRTFETWYSPEYDLTVESTGHRVTPQPYELDTALSNIQLGEPDPKLFEIPAGFTEDTRHPATAPAPRPTN